MNIFSPRDTFNYAREGVNEFSHAWSEREKSCKNNFMEDNSESQDILEADLLYGDGSRGDSLLPVLDRLEDRGYHVEKLNKNDIYRADGELYVRDVPADQLAGKDMIWRGVSKWKNMLEDIEDLGLSGVKTLPTPQGVLDCDDKKRTKQRLEERDVSATGTYESLEEIEEARSQGKTIVEKPPHGSCGAGVEFIDPEDSLYFDPDNLYEEFVDHYEDPYTVERRAVTFTGDNVNQIVEVKNRELKEDPTTPRPKNMSNDNGEYSDLNSENRPLADREIDEILDAAEAMSGGVLGIDYTVNLRTGETKVIEVNSNVGVTGIREESNVDFYDTLADSIEKEIEEDYAGRTYSDHLEDVKGYSFEERGIMVEESYEDALDTELESIIPDQPNYAGSDNPDKAATV